MPSRPWKRSEWEIVARQWFNERKGRPAPGYDSNLANALSVLDGPMPALWPQFEALKRVPLMVLRGETSDILSQETVEEMRRRHPAMTAMTVKGQGHAPLLQRRAVDRGYSRFSQRDRSARPVRAAELCLRLSVRAIGRLSRSASDLLRWLRLRSSAVMCRPAFVRRQSTSSGVCAHSRSLKIARPHVPSVRRRDRRRDRIGVRAAPRSTSVRVP